MLKTEQAKAKIRRKRFDILILPSQRKGVISARASVSYALLFLTEKAPA
ncbi:hypothetical protein HMPREF9069_01641 [Atopobium sp. oral taxon 810 str. F0209]|nr:hypothetical protein HMPREF9069_01641 [Atopobium sp. oral taxon 810 str. F0209]